MDHAYTPRLTIRHLLRRSWHLVSGTKKPILWLFIATLMTLVIYHLIVFNLSIFKNLPHADTAYSTRAIVSGYAVFLIQQFIAAPFLAGAFMIGIRRARNETVTISAGFLYFYKWLSLGAAMVLITILSLLTTAIFWELMMLSAPQSLSAIETGVGLITFVAWLFEILLLFTLPLIIDKELSLFRAFLVSAKAVSKHYLLVIVVILISIVLNFIGTALFFIGLLWTMPMTVIMWGVLYHYLIDHKIDA
jgi:hypothetical protein